MADTPPAAADFPTLAGILFGLGLGGFFDGIVLHQVLQWHHMLSTWYPITDVPSLELNTLWDGIFHSSTYVFVVIGLFILWRTAHKRHLLWSSKLLVGTLLLGWGIFNVVEGIVDHEVLGVHHVNELVPPRQRIYWDIAFLFWGSGHACRWLGSFAIWPARNNGDDVSCTMFRVAPWLQPALRWIVLVSASSLRPNRYEAFNPTLDEFLLISRCLSSLHNS